MGVGDFGLSLQPTAPPRIREIARSELRKIERFMLVTITTLTGPNPAGNNCLKNGEHL
jgi:hypothetical protein